MASLAGHFLVAGPTLVDPNFFRTVVLIVQHNDQGALGLVLNRPTTATVADVWAKLAGEEGEAESESADGVELGVTGSIRHGGPCEGPLMVLHDEPAAGDLEIIPGLYFTTDRGKIEHLLQFHTSHALVFVGYSGWSAGQLESELASNSWLVAPAKATDPFDPTVTWGRLATRALLSPYVRPEQIPDDPSVN